jgi:hypothetical protein
MLFPILQISNMKFTEMALGAPFLDEEHETHRKDFPP